jgi:hypothetical protein
MKIDTKSTFFPEMKKKEPFWVEIKEKPDFWRVNRISIEWIVL